MGMAQKISTLLDDYTQLGPQHCPQPAPELLPSHGMIAGETVSEWTEDWWTWALQAPAATNPLLDPDGSYAAVNNTAKMFFIAGSLGGDVTRSFDVPAGKPLLVPILNDIALQFNGLPGEQTGGKGAGNKVLVDWQKSVTSLHLTIDGKSIGNLQADFIKTDWFSLGMPQPGSLAATFLTGEIAPSKSAGYWAVIGGLAHGSTHTLDFGGTTNTGFSLDVQDTIHVV
jgi:hypothetical protein